jgi:hypothetical protein
MLKNHSKSHSLDCDYSTTGTSIDGARNDYLDSQKSGIYPDLQSNTNSHWSGWHSSHPSSSPPTVTRVRPDEGSDLDTTSPPTDPSIPTPNSPNNPSTDPAPLPEPSPVPRYRSQIDFNGDGRSDLLWRNYTTGQNEIWLMQDTTLVSSVLTTPVADANWRLQATGDFNRDRRTDLVWRNYATGQNAIWLMNGTTLATWVLTRPEEDPSWQIRGAGDFNRDGSTDLLWQRESSGETIIWLMNGTSYATYAALPRVSGVNFTIQGVNDFNGDGRVDVLWHNQLSGENLVWLMNGTAISSTVVLQSFPNTNWQVQLTDDLNRDGQTDILWRNQVTGENLSWLMNGLTVQRSLSYPQRQSPAWSTAPQDTYTSPQPITLSNLAFSGQEGDSGTFQVRLTSAPTTNVTLTLAAGNFLVVDADGNLSNGTQSSITFTPTNWNQPRTVWFIAEVDNATTNRLIGNTVTYTLSGGLTGSGIYELATVTNNPRYNPDPTRFNIHLDFRNDNLGFWTPERQAIAQQAADAWAARIDNEWNGLQLDHSLARLDYNSYTYSFTTRRFVDDLLIFVNPVARNTAENFGAINYEFGGWTTPTSPAGATMPRVGQVSVSTALYSPTYIGNNTALGNAYLYNVMTHEIGHVLGLVGLNWTAYNRLDTSTPQTAVFRGDFSGAVPLQSQDGASPVTGTYDYYHPAARVQSIMSYGWLYRVDGVLDGRPSNDNFVEGPTEIDFAMLADSGYRVRGYNARVAAANAPDAIAPTPTSTSATISSATNQPPASTILADTEPVLLADGTAAYSNSTANLAAAIPPPQCTCAYCSGGLDLLQGRLPLVS